jgi:hypothetical protein
MQRPQHVSAENDFGRRFMRRAQSPGLLHHEDRVRFRILAPPDCPQDGARIPCVTSKCSRRSAKRSSISARIRDEQDHVRHTRIPLLQCHPALSCLNVVEDRFGVHGDPPSDARDHRVPGASVSADRETNLCSPPERWMHLRAQAFEQPLLARVTDRIPGGEHLEAKVKTNRPGHTCQDPKIGIADRAGLDPLDRGSGDLARSTDVLEAETGRAS